MFTDEHRRSVWQKIRQQDLRAFAKLLTPQVLSEAARCAGVAMGRGPLGLANLAWLAVASALHAGRNFADVLLMTLKLLRDADALGRAPSTPPRRGRTSKHDPRPQDPAALSEETFAQARGKAPAWYWMTLILIPGEKFRARHAALLNWRGHRLLALDGTTLRLNNWRALREHFGAAANGKQGRTTQARLVMISFPLARMPWKYRLCPLSCSERTCAATLLKGLAEGDLVLMDRGFWSYGLFCQIARQRAFFAIRLFAKAKLKTVRRLGRGDRLVRYCPADRKWKDLPRSMTLRVIRYQVSGFRATALVTNRLDRRITPRRWVGLATRNHAGGRSLPPPLGDRDPLLRDEGPPEDGRLAARAERGGHRVRGGWTRVTLPSGALADGGGGGGQGIGSPASELPGRSQRTFGHGPGPAAG